MKSRPYVKDEGAGSALQASSVAQACISEQSPTGSRFSLPAVAIVSRDVGVSYSMQLDLAEPHSSLMTKLAFISQARPLGLHEFGVVRVRNATFMKI